ncbi:MAG: V-type ATP synthase subunit I [bacterium]
MLKPARMAKIDLQVPEDHIAKITLGIANLNIIHLMNVRKTPLGELDVESNQENTLLNKYKELQRKVRSICQLLQLELNKIPRASMLKDLNPHGDVVRIEERIKKIEKEIEPVLLNIRSMKNQKEEKDALLKNIDMVQKLGIEVDKFIHCKFLYIAAGLMPTENIERLALSLSNMYHILLPSTKLGNRRLVFVLGSKKDQEKIEKALRSAYFEKFDFNIIKSGSDESNVKDLKNGIREIKKRINENECLISTLKQNIKKDLLELNQRILLSLNILNTAKSFDKVGNSYHISGWVPADILPDFEKIVKNTCPEHTTMNVLTTDKIKEGSRNYFQIPTCLKNPFFLKPFEKIIFGYGIPHYNEVEPTLFFSVSFLLMFGVMFGDVGHGLTMCVLGFLAFIKYKEEFLRQMGLIIMECGTMSIIFGFLYGSIFGFEHILPALWFHPMENISYFMKITVGFGIGIISLGLILNIVNSIKNKDFLKGIFGELGIMGLIFYWGCVGLLIIYALRGTMLFSSHYILFLLLLPLLVIFFKEPIYNLYNRFILGKKVHILPSNLGLYVMESFIEVGDTIIGFLSNTVSFIRVAAFALAHAGLFFAVFSLANTMQLVKGGILWYWIVIILGNIGIIAIEGLVVSIQTIRLEYYEFFSKFFKGGGELYQPLINE